MAIQTEKIKAVMDAIVAAQAPCTRAAMPQDRVGDCPLRLAGDLHLHRDTRLADAMPTVGSRRLALCQSTDESVSAVIAAIVPAHNEEDHLAACLQSLQRAACCADLLGEPITVVVVLDSCSDASEAIARRCGADVLTIQARNVGAARALGAQRAIELGARWLAFTDADSVVDPGWLAAQLAQRSDAVCGSVAVTDWGSYGEAMRKHYDATYTDADGHHHIHGANLGVSTDAYLAAGGFRRLESSEDVALVEVLEAQGALIAWSASPRVVTSARRIFRAPLGFGATLLRVERESQQVAAAGTA